MIEFVKGDCFETDADIRVNTVNCVGVMGAGVALAFKKKYPTMFKEYAKQCRAGDIVPGTPTVWHESDMFSKGIEIINFPTKSHWRKPSEYEYIEKGLIWLSIYLNDKTDKVVTIPALGCGHGGLDWEIVKELIIKYLSNSPGRLLIFEPAASKKTIISAPEPEDLELSGISKLNNDSISYPHKLSRYTEKPLYLLGSKYTEFDISIISSSKPTEIEKNIVFDLIEYCAINKLSILFGGSVFDKKMASHALSKGIVAGVFLPNGMLKSAEKLNSTEQNVEISVLSIANPFEPSSRKDYLPSVLSRIFISDRVFFTTNKLAWLKKQKSKFTKNNFASYFIIYADLNSEDLSIALDSGLIGIEPLLNKVSFNDLPSL